MKFKTTTSARRFWRSFFSALFFLGLASLQGNLFSQVINLEHELVARYLFEGDARNIVEDANHGIETNIVYEMDRFEQPNSCIYLNGTDGYITIPHTDDLNWDARFESYSILFWVKSSNPAIGSDKSRRLLTKWSGVLTEPYPFQITALEVGLHIAIFDTKLPTLSSNYSNPWNGVWHHFAMVYSHEANSLSYYVNGVLIETATKQLANTTQNSTDIYIGLSPLNEKFFLGYFDDLYFYNRAIEACEIEALYSGQLLNER